jgi:CDP-diacylglycerol--glycerol-3-phosphate 3-phosphatidyltransferase
MTKPRFIQLLTASRLFLAAAVAVLLTAAGPVDWALAVTFVLIGLIELTDLFDGHLARRWQVVSTFGKMFDPFCDAVSRLTVYWSLSQVGLCWTVVPLVMAVRDVTVAYIRAAKAGAGGDVSARWPGKLKAWIHGLTGLVLVLAALLAPDIVAYLVAPASIAVMFFSLAALADHLIAAWPALRETIPGD